MTDKDKYTYKSECGKTFTIEPFPIALKRKEAIIEKGMADAAEAFEDIRKFRLYRIDYPGKTFDEYCKLRWRIARQNINFLIAARKVTSKTASQDAKKISMTGLGRHLARVHSTKAQKEIIEKITANGHKPTVAEVRKAVDERLNIKRKVTIRIPKELRDELKRTGKCPLCGHKQ